MSDSKGKRAMQVGVLIIVGCLALVVVACGQDGNQADLWNALATVESKADAAQQSANEAMAQQQATPLPTQEIVTGNESVLAGGIEIIYQSDAGVEQILYPVDRVEVYYTFQDFQDVWSAHPSTLVEAGWTIAAHESAWNIFFADRPLGLDPDATLSQVTLEHWREYAVYTQIVVPPGEEEVNEPAAVTVSQGPRQDIGDQNMFSAPLGVGELPATSAPGGAGLPWIHLLLAPESEGETGYTLVTMLNPLYEAAGEPTPEPLGPEPKDTPARQHCRRCVKWTCKLSCWFRR